MSDRSSPTSKILLSPGFTDKDAPKQGDFIDFKTLCSFALIYCQTDLQGTAKVFYKVLQEGGVASQTWVAFDDKDLEPCFARMCKIVLDLATFYSDETQHKLGFSSEEIDKMREGDEVMDDWLDGVFGNESRLDESVFRD